MQLKTVVVIGAGMSGLRAAAVLRAKRRDLRVVVLEARDRIGGRIYTHDGKHDHGASWIHGTEGNPLTPIAKETGAELYSLSSAAILDVDQGRWLSSRETGAVMGFVYSLSERAVDYAKCTKDIDPTRNFGDWCEREIEQSNLSADEKRRAKRLMHFYTNVTAADIYEQSLRNYVVEEKLPGDEPMVRNGYSRLVEYVARGVDVQLRSQVLAITDDAVEYEDLATSTKHKLAYDAVILTVPLGVLHSKSIKVELPAMIERCIHSIGFGTAEKLFIGVERPFWRSGRLQSSCEPSSYPLDVDMYAFCAEPLIEFITLPGSSLLLYVAAATAAKLRAMSDAERRAFVMPYISRMPGYEGSQITMLEMTNWLADPFSRGSYSYAPVGSRDTRADCHTLSKGVPDKRLWLAGEHAVAIQDGTEIGTAHGAYLSGQRAAEHVMAAL